MLPRSYNEQHWRKWQIDNLKTFNDRVIETKENSEFRVEFTAADKNMSLDVILSSEFPKEKPVIFVNPVVPHPWVAENSNQVVNSPGLLNFTMHSDLGRVVQAIIREFQKFIVKRCHEKVDSEITSHNQIIAHSQLFPELADLTIEELREILENSDLQDKIIENSPQIIELELKTEEVMNNIESIAQENLIKQQTLGNLKTQVIDKISTIVQMKMNYEELNRKHQKLSEMYDPHRIRDCLKEAALKADEEAERIAEEFLLGNIPVETFVAKFAEKRALGQARRAREERLAHQLAQLDRA